MDVDGTIFDCDEHVVDFDVREYLAMRRDMPGIIDTLDGLAKDVGNGLDPVRAMISVSALAQQLRKDHQALLAKQQSEKT